MGKKSGETSQAATVQIPPEVLARYNAVNARAEDIAGQPFTPYGGDFVAPINSTQQAGITNINQAQGVPYPYYDAATQAMNYGFQTAQPYYGAASDALYSGQNNANQMNASAIQNFNTSYNSAQPYQGQAYQNYASAQDRYSPYEASANQNMWQAQNAANYYQSGADQGISNAEQGAQGYQNAALGSLGDAFSYAQPYQDYASQGYQNAYRGAQPYQGAATQAVNNSYSGAQGYNNTALQGFQDAYSGAQPYQQEATSAARGARNSAQPYQDYAAQGYQQGLGAAQPFQQAAAAGVQNAFAAATPLQQSSSSTLGGAYQGAQAYQQGATQGVANALNAGQPYSAAATQGINSAYDRASPYNSMARGNIDAALSAVQPYMASATMGYSDALSGAQPYNDIASQNMYSALARSQPYQNSSAQNINNAYNQAQQFQGLSSSGTQRALDTGRPYQGAATQGINSAFDQAQPFQNKASGNIDAALAAVQPYMANATAGFNNALIGAQPQMGAADQNVYSALARAQPLQSNASQNINNAFNTAQGYQQSATQGVQEALSSAVPYNQSSEDQLRTALSGAQGYENVAKALGLSGADAVNPNDLNNEAINKYMSPYQQNVIDATMKGLRDQQKEEQSTLLGNQIMSGAFGGDRGRIAQANLAKKQELATAQTLSGLLNQGYGQALGTAQQQQGQQLAAEQANRAARAQTGSAMAALGQQGFGQNLSAAQQLAALGQQNYSQGLGAAQQLANIGQQGFGQGAALAQQQAALGNQEYTQGLGASQQLANLGNMNFSQGSQTAQNLANLGQQQFGQGMTAAQQQAALGNQAFNQGAQRAQQLAAIGQQGFGQELAAAQQQGALGQQGFGQGATLAQQLAALGQQEYGQGLGASQQFANLGNQNFTQRSQTAQNMANLGQMGFGQGLQAAQNYANIGQQEFGQGAARAQQLAAIGQQDFGQNLSAAQQLASIGQQGFGQGATTAQQQAALAQQLFGQEMAGAQQNAALGNQAYQQNTNTADRMAALGQQRFSQDTTIGQLLASLGQQGYQQGTGTAQQIANLGNQNFNQGMQAAQQYGNIGQQGYQQAANTAQNMAGLGQQGFQQRLAGSQQYGALGQQGFAQGLAAAQQRAALGQQAFGQGMNLASQNAALGQQGYNQNMNTGQQLAALANQMYAQGMGVGDRQANMAQQMMAQGNAAAQGYQGFGQSLAALANTYGQGLAGLGSTAFENALKGAQAQITAGTLQQQTQQAQNQADYNQFLQQQGYPFQTTQFLGNLAMGTGALSGQNTGATTTSPVPWMSSDRRLKDNIQPVGKTFDGQNIYRYNYKDEPTTRLGLIAQEVEKKHPEAVGLAGGYRMVDYAKATADAADRGHFASGGLAGNSEGGAVLPHAAGMGFASGGAPDFEAMLAEILGGSQGKHPFDGVGIYGRRNSKSGPYGTALDTQRYALPPPPRLLPPAQMPSASQQLNETMGTARSLGSLYDVGKETANGENMLGRLLGLGAGADKFPVKGADLAPSTAIRKFEDTPLKSANFSDTPTRAASDGAKALNPASQGASDVTRTGNQMGLNPNGTGSLVTNANFDMSGAGSGIGGSDVSSIEPVSSGLAGDASGLGAAGVSEGTNAALTSAELAGEGAAAAETGGEAAMGIAELLSSFFSDKRLKENIRPVGKTFDGQTVYSFNYKGDRKTQMGLIAQEVEKKHPEAVGLAGGYKTVNYHDATDNAAKRGHFNIGGGAIDPMKAPGMNEGLGAGMPYGMDRNELPFDTDAPIVPEYITHFKSPTDLQNQQRKLSEPSSQIKQSGGGGGMDPGLQTALTVMSMVAMMASDKRAKENIRPVGKTFDGQNIYSFNYKGDKTTQMGLIAQEVEKRTPKAVGSVNGYKGVDYKKATNAAAKRGRFNRGGYEDGGTPIIEGTAEEVDPRRELLRRSLEAIRRVESGGREDPYRAMGTPTKTGDRAHGAYQVMGRNIPEWSEAALGRRLTPEEFLANQNAQDRIAEHRFGQYLGREGTPQNAASMWFTGKPIDRAGNPQDANGTTNYEYLRRFNTALGVDPATGIPAGGLAPRQASMQNDIGGQRQFNTVLDVDPATGIPAGGFVPRQASMQNNIGGQRQFLADIQNMGGKDLAAADQATARSQDRTERGGVKFANAANQEGGDWMQRNQHWLVPILTGLGTMAGSQSRYFLPALLQGVAGGASTYANMQNTAEGQRIKRGELEVAQENARTSSLRENNEQRRLGITLFNEWRKNFRPVTDKNGDQLIEDTTTGRRMTPADYARDQARIMRQFGITTEDIGTPLPADAGTGGGSQGNQTGDQSRANTPQQNQPQPQPQPAPQQTPPINPGATPAAPQQPGQQPGQQAPQQPGQQAGQQPPGNQQPNTREAENQAFVNARMAEIERIKHERDQAETVWTAASRHNSSNLPQLWQRFEDLEKRYRHLTEQDHRLPNGVVYRIRPGTQIDLTPPPPVTPEQVAKVDPNTGVVSSVPVNVGYTATGGLPISPNTPTRNVEIVSDPVLNGAREASRAASTAFLRQSEQAEDNIPNLLRFATALKILEGQGLNTTRADLANTLNGLGLNTLARGVMDSPDISAAITSVKTQIAQAIVAANGAFDRTTQNEFNTVANRMMPTADMTPDAVRQLMVSQMAQSMYTTQLRRDWNEAQAQGVQNYEAFSDRWRRQHPPGLFMDSAERLAGNLRGQNLPSQFTEGVLYVMPTDRAQYNAAPEALRKQFRPGDLFVATDVRTAEDGRQSVGAMPVPRTVDAFNIYRRAPGFQLYGAQ